MKEAIQDPNTDPDTLPSEMELEEAVQRVKEENEGNVAETEMQLGQLITYNQSIQL